MPTELDPIIGNWYEHLDKGQSFEVVAVDEDNGMVETQDIDGNVSEFDIDDWYNLEIDVCEPPENWSAPMDLGERDDFNEGGDDDYDDQYDEYPDEEE